MSFYHDFPIPSHLRTPDFTLHPLTPRYAAIDYEAYIASPNVIDLHSVGRWQIEGYTLEENQRATAWHAAAHQRRESFAFILLTPDETRGLGCVYFNPLLPRLINQADAIATDINDHTTMVTFWIREGEEKRLSFPVVQVVEAWLHQEWHFSGHYWRVNQQETASIHALAAAGLTLQFSIGEQPLYHFYK